MLEYRQSFSLADALPEHGIMMIGASAGGVATLMTHCLPIS
jgi:hypothetical protein